ncbi:MAG: ion transporter [Aestuariibacter sp.]
MWINLKNLRESKQGVWFAIDLFMMVLLAINLLLIIFDSLYAVSAIRSAIQLQADWLIHSYQPIHDNFLLVDLVFISIFLSEFMLRWIVAVINKEYMRWYFFPFIHWYDLLGCIPAESARILRLLRIISILHRLHKYRVINLKNTAIYRFFAFYYNVFIEELSDRIVVKVLTDAQEDIATGSQLLHDITDQVLAPRRETLTEWIAETLQHYGRSIADPEVGSVLRSHIAGSVAKAVKDDPQVGILSAVPVFGGNLEKRLETAVANIVIQSIVNLLTDINTARVDSIVAKGLTAPSLTEQRLDEEVLSIVNESLELVKVHIGQQRWKAKL